MDDPNGALTATTDDTQQQTNVRDILKPLYDKLCSQYEGRDARHRGMPSIDSVVESMNGKILENDGFFHGLHNKKRNAQCDNGQYVSVCTQQETRRTRQFISSNGLG